MTLTDEQLTEVLISTGVSPNIAKVTAKSLRPAMALYQIDTAQRMAGLIGQLMVESISFTHTEESLYYTTLARIEAVFSKTRGKNRKDLVRNPKGLANFVYAGRNGNGTEASGDGWNYRGSGWIQTTGKNNFQKVFTATKLDVVSKPDLLRTDDSAIAQAACVYWSDNKLNRFADKEDWDSITKGVNGPAMLEAKQRAAYSKKALAAFKRLGVQ